jgi:hypothetical protein
VSVDEFASYDAAYVLGALAPEERHAFEQHLKSCADCSASVMELAGMPGLLSRVSAAQVLEPPESPPPTLLPALLGEVDAERRKRRRMTVAYRIGALAAAACLVVFAVLGISALTRGPAGSPVASTPMQQLVSTPLSVDASFVHTSWGTRIDLHCTYAKVAGYQAGSYALVVTDVHGKRQQVATWWAGPGTDTTVTGSTNLSRSEIASIEVETIGGTPLLRLGTPVSSSTASGEGQIGPWTGA